MCFEKKNNLTDINGVLIDPHMPNLKLHLSSINQHFRHLSVFNISIWLRNVNECRLIDKYIKVDWEILKYLFSLIEKYPKICK